MKKQFTDKAKKMWDAIPTDIQDKILANVFCGQCLKAVQMVDYTGAVKKGMVVLTGKCSICGGTVARVLD